MKTPLDKDLNKAYEAFNQNHNHLRQTLMASLPDRAEQHKPAGRANHALAFIGDTIMRSRITKIAAAAVIIIVLMVGINEFGGSGNGAGVAWGDVLENIHNSKTLTFLIRAEEQGLPSMKVMVIDPYLSRVEFLIEIPDSPISGKQIRIIDKGQGRGLILNTVKKTAKVCRAEKTGVGLYGTFRNFRDLVDFSVDKIGSRQIGDKQAIGFKLKKQSQKEQTIVKEEIKVWADPETKLPILMEATANTAEGQIIHQIITDIVFDAELNESLFSLEPPDEYELEVFDGDDYVNRIKSAVNMDRILKACREYVDEHDGQWPDNLQDLAKYGVNKPALEGYIYLKPPASPSESRIVLYEAYDSWNDGIGVGFADGHIEFIKEESDFKNRLGKNQDQR